MTKKLSLTNVILILSIFSSTFIIAQDVDLELKAGINFTFLKFDHATPVQSNIEGLLDEESSNFGIVFSAPIKKSRFRLRSEIGYTSWNDYLTLEYNLFTGLIDELQIVQNQFKNDKIYISICPEFKIHISDVDFKFHAGFLNHIDISNNIRDPDNPLINNPVLSFDSEIKLGGYTIGGAVVVKLGNIGISSSISYLSFRKSEFFAGISGSHPYFKLRQFQFAGGIVYYLGSSDKE